MEGWSYLSMIVPLSLFNMLGSLQNLESAEAAGDRYEARSTLAVDGLGTVVAALCGSPFPTTVYIGHPGGILASRVAWRFSTSIKPILAMFNPSRLVG